MDTESFRPYSELSVYFDSTHKVGETSPMDCLTLCLLLDEPRTDMNQFNKISQLKAGKTTLSYTESLSEDWRKPRHFQLSILKSLSLEKPQLVTAVAHYTCLLQHRQVNALGILAPLALVTRG